MSGYKEKQMDRRKEKTDKDIDGLISDWTDKWMDSD